METIQILRRVSLLLMSAVILQGCLSSDDEDEEINGTFGDLVGVWELESFGDGSLKPGDAMANYWSDECPDVARGTTIYHGITWLFTETNYERLIDESGVSFNVYTDENCEIYADEMDTEFERGIDDYAGTYEVKGNVLVLGGDLDTSVDFKFLNSEKTKFQISAGEYKEIYGKE